MEDITCYSSMEVTFTWVKRQCIIRTANLMRPLAYKFNFEGLL